MIRYEAVPTPIKAIAGAQKQIAEFRSERVEPDAPAEMTGCKRGQG